MRYVILLARRILMKKVSFVFVFSTRFQSSRAPPFLNYKMGLLMLNSIVAKSPYITVSGWLSILL